MAVSTTEAAAALRDIAQTDRRTRVSGAYYLASPHFILWGLIWAIGYTLSGFVPPARWGLVWLPLIAVGIVGVLLIGRRSRADRDTKISAVTSAKSIGMAVAIGLFIGSVYFVFQPATPLPYLVFPALIAALIYVLIGCLLGLSRYVAIGAIMFLITILGFVFAKSALPFWIAASGGGGLVLGGLWMRRV